MLTVTKNSSDITATDRLKQRKQSLERAKYQPVCNCLESEAEKVIVNCINKQDISFLLMGAYGHNRIHNLVISSKSA